MPIETRNTLSFGHKKNIFGWWLLGKLGYTFGWEIALWFFGVHFVAPRENSHVALLRPSVSWLRWMVWMVDGYWSLKDFRVYVKYDHPKLHKKRQADTGHRIVFQVFSDLPPGVP